MLQFLQSEGAVWAKTARLEPMDNILSRMAESTFTVERPPIPTAASPGRRDAGGPRVAPQWLLLVAITFAPWAFGCVHGWAMTALTAELGLALIFWLIACAAQREWPKVPKVLAGVAVSLIALGWIAVLNAQFEYDPDALYYEPLNRFLKFGPGSIYRSLSLQSVLHWTVLLGVSCFVCDLAADRRWRKRVWSTMAFNGAALALLGVAQRMTGAKSIFWSSEHSGAFFATFVNHDNAAAFLNLTWPLLGAGLLLALDSRTSSLRGKAAWGAGLILTLAAVLVSGSRTASLIALLLFAAGFGWFAWRTYEGDFVAERRFEALAAGLLVLLLIAAATVFAGFDLSLEKWSRLKGELNINNSRWVAYQVCWKMAGKAGSWGFGPGTFETAFPYFTQHLGDALKGRWTFAHQDYLQTVIEWGYIGSALLGIYVFGGFVQWYCAGRGLRGRSPSQSGFDLRNKILHLGIVLALAGVLLHALVDFPLQIFSIQLYTAILLGLLWGSLKNKL